MSDEGSFFSTGQVDIYKMLGDATEQVIYRTRTIDHKHKWPVWAGIMGDHIVGPFFFGDN